MGIDSSRCYHRRRGTRSLLLAIDASMNVHVTDDIRKKFPAWEFRGHPFYDKNGKRWIRAKSKIFYSTWYYSFEKDNIYDGLYLDIEPL